MNKLRGQGKKVCMGWAVSVGGDKYLKYIEVRKK